MTLKQGDIITHKDGSKRKVLGVVGEAVFVSTDNDFTNSAPYYYTETDILKLGYTFPKEKWTPNKGAWFHSAVYDDGQWKTYNANWVGSDIQLRCQIGLVGIHKTEEELADRIALIEAKLKEI